MAQLIRGMSNHMFYSLKNVSSYMLHADVCIKTLHISIATFAGLNHRLRIPDRASGSEKVGSRK